MIPSRISILTCNLWNTEKWEQRRPAVFEFLRRFSPDICCFQELRSRTADEIDLEFSDYTRVQDDFRGWLNEGNIYYRKDYFEEIQHGEVPLDMPEEDRRLFWLRLNIRDTDRSLIVATVHLTHQNNADEQQTGQSYRHMEALKIARWAEARADRKEPLILAGDFNDPLHPVRILSEAGLRDAFLELGLLSPPTFPSLPSTDEITMNESIDKIMSSGDLRPLSISVPTFYFRGSSMSDHWPVLGVFELT